MAQVSPRLISVANVVADILAEVPALPPRGGDVMATASGITPGGAFNTMVAARRLGMEVVYAGSHGTGPLGDLARRAMADAGIQALGAPVLARDTGWDVALVEPDGERTFVTSIGAEADLDAARLALARVRPEDFVHVSGYSLLRDPNRATIVTWLGEIPAEVTVLVDPGPLVGDIDQAVLDAVWARADWWSCNRREALLSSGCEQVADAAAWLGARTRGVIVRTGAEGCLVAPPGHAPVTVPGRRVQAIDTTGAGDAHAAGFLTGLAEGLPPERAAAMANACAALSVTRRGPATGPTRAELDAFLGDVDPRA